MVISATLLTSILFMNSMTQNEQPAVCATVATDAAAARVSHAIRLDAAHPAAEWRRAEPVSFCSDWQGENAQPELETRVRILWSPDTLYLRFEVGYRELYFFDDAGAGGRRDRLWERDVAEVFLQPDPSRPLYYREFEISPNGMWLDLDISPGGQAELKSGLTRSVFVDERAKSWAAELAIPMKALTPDFDPRSPWRVNFFRVEGRREPRRYMAWHPTHSASPNFHVPSVFGRLRFEGER